MRTVKLLVLFTMSTSLLSSTNAQIKLPGLSTPIQQELEKVVKDYFNHFINKRCLFTRIHNNFSSNIV